MQLVYLTIYMHAILIKMLKIINLVTFCVLMIAEASLETKSILHVYSIDCVTQEPSEVIKKIDNTIIEVKEIQVLYLID